MREKARTDVPPRFRVSRPLAVVLAVTALAGCTAGPSSRPPVVENEGPPPQTTQPADEPAPLPPLTEPSSPSMQWNDCDEETRARFTPPTTVPDTLRFACSHFTSTVDAPNLPQRGIKRIATLKVGTGSIPLTVVNDVDGEPGTLYAARLAAGLPPEFLQRFSLIGVDRRGTGESDPVRCVPQDVRGRMLGHDPAAGSTEPLLDAARKAGQQCSISLENEQGSIDSWRAAGDLEELRQQLGMDHLHALSHGEGSKVLTSYASRYTDRVGRFVLDGAPDPTPDAVTVQDGIAAGLESTLDAFGTDCAARGCPVGPDAAAAVTALTEQVRTTRPGRFGPAEVLYAVSTGLAERARWPELGDAIAAARSGDTGKLGTFLEPLRTEDRVRPSRLDGALATKCNDTATRLAGDRIDQVTADLRAKHPVFGGLAAQRLAWCGPWPVRSEPLPPAAAPGAPPILFASTATDPVTPEQGTIRTADQMPGSVRVAWQGAGHGALESPCVAGAVRGFLADGRIPRDGTLCPA